MQTFHYSHVIQPQHNIFYAITCQRSDHELYAKKTLKTTYIPNHTSMRVRMHTCTKQAFIYAARANQQPSVLPDAGKHPYKSGINGRRLQPCVFFRSVHLYSNFESWFDMFYLCGETV